MGDGGAIDEWNIEGALFRHAVGEAKYAMESSNLIAILWHQGESDSRGGNYTGYYKKLDIIVKELLKYAEHNKNCYFVTGKKLYSNPDGIHINAESQRRFGIRYFAAYQKQANVYEPIENETQRINALYQREHTATEKKLIALEHFTLGKSTLEEVMKFLTVWREKQLPNRYEWRLQWII